MSQEEVRAMEGGRFVAAIRRMRESGRVPHAFLLSGTPGVPERTAVQAARTLLCERPDLPLGGCGECGACRRAASGNHPGLAEISPDGASVRIARVKAALLLDSRRGTVESEYTVMIFPQAHRLTVESSNAILKWVEDPYSGRIFFFCAPAASALLSTLLSRLMVVRLQESGDSGPVPAGHGWPGTEEKFARVYDLVLELGELAARGDPQSWLRVGPTLGRLSLTADEAGFAADLLSALFRDAAASRSEIPPALLGPVRERWAETAAGTDEARLWQLALRAAEMRRSLQSRVNPVLVFESFCIGAAGL